MSPTAVKALLPPRHHSLQEAASWFRALGDAACKVEFQLAYEFATPILEHVVGPAFNRIANTFIEAFVRRAEAVHGPRV